MNGTAPNGLPAGALFAGSDPQFAAAGLTNNGGDTPTIALTAQSTAVLGQGITADYPGTSTPITTDQRGITRATPPNLGAYEGFPAESTMASVTSAQNPSTYGQSVIFTATITSGSTPAGSVDFVIDSGTPVAGIAGSTTGTTAAWTYSTSALSAGIHTVEADYVGTGTFSDSTGTLSGGQTVNTAALTVTATDESMTYGGSVPALTYTYTGLVNGDSTASFSGGLTSTATSSTSVGGYPITQGTLAATGNYAIGTFNAGTLTVNAAPLTVTAANKSMTYGGTVPALTYTYTGLVNGDSTAAFSGGLTTTAMSSTSVGGYPITQGTLAATGNYAIGTFNGGTLTINKAATGTMVVSSANRSVYGQAVTFTATVTNTSIGSTPVPTGTVQFVVDGSNFGAPVLVGRHRQRRQPARPVLLGSQPHRPGGLH